METTKKEKLSALLQTQTDFVLISDYVIKKDDKFYQASIVSIDSGKTYKGFQLTEICNPSLSNEEKIEFVVDKYGDKAVYDGFIAKLVIEKQQSARKSASGNVPVFNMETAWKMFYQSDGFADIVQTGEHEKILSFLREKWTDYYASDNNDSPKFFL